MAEECLLSMPEAYDLDYTMKEYMSYVEYINKCVGRLNSQSPSDETQLLCVIDTDLFHGEV